MGAKGVSVAPTSDPAPKPLAGPSPEVDAAAEAFLTQLEIPFERDPKSPGSPIVKVDAKDRPLDDRGLAVLARLPVLRWLQIAGTQVEEKDETVLAECKKLEYLSATFSNESLQAVGGLAALRELDVGAFGPATDVGLAHLGGLANLRKLNVSYYPMSDADMAHVAGLTQMQELCLNATQVGDEGPRRLPPMQDLGVLWLGGCPVTDAGAEHLRRFARLETLVLNATHVTDAGLPALGNFRHLATLWLVDTQLTDGAVAYLASMKSLKHLNVTGTKLTPEGIKRLREALPECTVLPEP